jgi:hypothetical protein
VFPARKGDPDAAPELFDVPRQAICQPGPVLRNRDPFASGDGYRDRGEAAGEGDNNSLLAGGCVPRRISAIGPTSL